MGFLIVAAGIQAVGDAARNANLEMKALAASAKDATAAVRDTSSAVDDLHKQSGISATGASGDLGTGTGVGSSGAGNVVSGLTNALKQARR